MPDVKINVSSIEAEVTEVATVEKEIDASSAQINNIRLSRQSKTCGHALCLVLALRNSILIYA